MITKTVICAGRRTLTDGKLGVCYVDEASGERMIYSLQGMKNMAAVGARYKFTFNEVDSLFTGGDNRPVPLGFGQHPDLAQWEIEDDRAKREDNVRKLAKGKHMKQIREAVAPLRRLYLASNNRNAFRLMVLDILDGRM